MTVTVPVQTNNLTDANGKPTEDMYRYMQSVKNTANALTTSNATKAAKAQTWEQSFFIEYPDAKDYRVVINSALARTIASVTTKSSAGTCTLTVKINASALGGTANSVSTSEQTQAHSSANALSVGDDIVLTFSSVSAVENVSVLLSGTMTLA